jgi:hypothetical protein
LSDYTGGKPKFGIEKPLVIPWATDKLIDMQNSGRWIAELKIDEDRGFICTDAQGKPSYYSHRNDSPTTMTGKVFDGVVLPPLSVFDGGHVYSKDLNRESRIYLFDVLVIEGQKLHMTFEERTALLRHTVTPSRHIWLSWQSKDFIQDFRNLLNGQYQLIETVAKLWGIPVPFLKKITEGFVIKNLDAKPAFPAGKIAETPASFKLRINDVLPSQRTWLKPV